MINSHFEYERISQNPDLFLFEMKECLNIKKQIFQDHMVSHSTFSCRFYRERKWHTLPWNHSDQMFDESNFFLFPATVTALPSLKIQELNSEYTKLTDFEKFYCYVSPYYMRYFIESASIRNDYDRLNWLTHSVSAPTHEWEKELKSFLKRYKVKVPKSWVKNHPLNRNKTISHCLKTMVV